VRVHRDKRASRLHHRQRVFAGRDDGVTANHQVSLGGIDLGAVDRIHAVRNLDVAPGGAAFLRQAARVLRHHAFAVQVRGHAKQLPDGDDARAANAAHHNAPCAFSHGQHRLRHVEQTRRIPLFFFLRLFQLSAFDGDKARAKAFHARIIFVAAVLVDAALAAEFGFQRLDRQAVGLHRAIATALTHQLIDDDTFGRVHHRAALAAATLFSGAGLVVNDGAASLDFTELALDAVQFITVLHFHAIEQFGAFVFFGLVGHDDQLAHALGHQALHDLQH